MRHSLITSPLLLISPPHLPLPLPTQPRDTSEYVSWETVRDFNPDIILIAPDRSCPDQAASLDGIGDLAHHKGWWSIRAVWENDVFVLAAGAEDLVNRPGPRMVDAVEALAHVLNWDSSRRVSVLPRGSLLKLKLQKGGRCRAKNLINFFNKV